LNNFKEVLIILDLSWLILIFLYSKSEGRLTRENKNCKIIKMIKTWLRKFELSKKFYIDFIWRTIILLNHFKYWLNWNPLKHSSFFNKRGQDFLTMNNFSKALLIFWRSTQGKQSKAFFRINLETCKSKHILINA
jgi:hypothetical protein